VTPGNVLQIRNALQAESDRLIAKLKLHQPALRVGEAGPDPISEPAAAAFNTKIASLVDGCWACGIVGPLPDSGRQHSTPVIARIAPRT
jgi:hypothetical protein